MMQRNVSQESNTPEEAQTFSKQGFYLKDGEVKGAIFWQISCSNTINNLYIPMDCKDCGESLWICKGESGTWHQCLVINSEIGLFTGACGASEDIEELRRYIYDIEVLFSEIVRKILERWDNE